MFATQNAVKLKEAEDKTRTVLSTTKDRCAVRGSDGYRGAALKREAFLQCGSAFQAQRIHFRVNPRNHSSGILISCWLFEFPLGRPLVRRLSDHQLRIRQSGK